MAKWLNKYPEKAKDGKVIPKSQEVHAQETQDYYNQFQKPEMNLQPLDPAFIRRAQEARDVVQSSAPKRSTISKAAAIARNPVTAASYKLQGKDIPDNFERGDRNVYDNAIDVLNPMTYLDAAGRTASLKHFREEGFTPDAILKTGLDAAMIYGIGNDVRSAIKPQEFELVPSRWDGHEKAYDNVQARMQRGEIPYEDMNEPGAKAHRELTEEYRKYNKKYQNTQRDANGNKKQIEAWANYNSETGVPDLSYYTDKGMINLADHYKISDDLKAFTKKANDIDNTFNQDVLNSPHYDGSPIDPYGASLLHIGSSPIQKITSNPLLYTGALSTLISNGKTQNQSNNNQRQEDTIPYIPNSTINPTVNIPRNRLYQKDTPIPTSREFQNIQEENDRQRQIMWLHSHNGETPILDSTKTFKNGGKVNKKNWLSKY